MTAPLGHLISPNFTASKASPGTFPDWVDVYEDRTWGWHLQHADALRRQGHNAAIAALHLAVAFIEPYEVFLTGQSSENRSKQFFRSGFKRIFNRQEPQLSPAAVDAAADAIYKQVRCGLAHAGMPGALVFLSNAAPGITVRLDPTTNAVSQIVLNPEAFVDAIVTEFRSYVAALRNPNDEDHVALKARFVEAWHVVHRPAP